MITSYSLGVTVYRGNRWLILLVRRCVSNGIRTEQKGPLHVWFDPVPIMQNWYYGKVSANKPFRLFTITFPWYFTYILFSSFLHCIVFQISFYFSGLHRRTSFLLTIHVLWNRQFLWFQCIFFGFGLHLYHPTLFCSLHCSWMFDCYVFIWIVSRSVFVYDCLVQSFNESLVYVCCTQFLEEMFMSLILSCSRLRVYLLRFHWTQLSIVIYHRT